MWLHSIHFICGNKLLDVVTQRTLYMWEQVVTRCGYKAYTLHVGTSCYEMWLHSLQFICRNKLLDVVTQRTICMWEQVVTRCGYTAYILYVGTSC
jgi:hypothetical protein